VTVAGLRHDAFVYEADDEFVGQMAAFLRAGFAEDAAAVAVTTRRNWALLRDALGSASDRVRFTERDDWYRRPVGAIGCYGATLRDLKAGGASSIRVIGEVGFGSTPEEWRQWTAYEAILDRVFADQPAWIVCPYDARALPDEVVEGAWRTHSQVLTDGWGANPHYDDPERVARSLAREAEPLPRLRPLPLGGNPGSFRDRLARALIAANVPEDKARDMLVAANEVVVNAWLHGGGPRAARFGHVGDRFVCEVSDGGPGLDDPLAGYMRPGPDPTGGAGLWIARQLTWRLDLLSSPDGLTVRLWV
jgi:anti-sigma regulatory factor (Ser/Thr protein kinase)